jgi:hypothetical protein
VTSRRMWVTSRQMTTRMRHFSQLILKPPNGEREEKRLNPVGEVRVRVFLKVQWGVSSLFCNTRREFASSFGDGSELRLPLRHFPFSNSASFSR